MSRGFMKRDFLCPRQWSSGECRCRAAAKWSSTIERGSLEPLCVASARWHLRQALCSAFWLLRFELADWGPKTDARGKPQSTEALANQLTQSKGVIVQAVAAALFDTAFGINCRKWIKRRLSKGSGLLMPTSNATPGPIPGWLGSNPWGRPR